MHVLDVKTRNENLIFQDFRGHNQLYDVHKIILMNRVLFILLL